MDICGGRESWGWAAVPLEKTKKEHAGRYVIVARHTAVCHRAHARSHCISLLLLRRLGGAGRWASLRLLLLRLGRARVGLGQQAAGRRERGRDAAALVPGALAGLRLPLLAVDAQPAGGGGARAAKRAARRWPGGGQRTRACTPTGTGRHAGDGPHTAASPLHPLPPAPRGMRSHLVHNGHQAARRGQGQAGGSVARASGQPACCTRPWRAHGKATRGSHQPPTLPPRPATTTPARTGPSFRRSLWQVGRGAAVDVGLQRRRRGLELSGHKLHGGHVLLLHRAPDVPRNLLQLRAAGLGAGAGKWRRGKGRCKLAGAAARARAQHGGHWHRAGARARRRRTRTSSVRRVSATRLDGSCTAYSCRRHTQRDTPVAALAMRMLYTCQERRCGGSGRAGRGGIGGRRGRRWAGRQAWRPARRAPAACRPQALPPAGQQRLRPASASLPASRPCPARGTRRRTTMAMLRSSKCGMISAAIARHSGQRALLAGSAAWARKDR